MAITLKDVAEELNVSVMTVSRVLNGRAGEMVSEQTRQRVLDTAADMGYQPNRLARALVTGRTNTVALLFYTNAVGLAFLEPLQRMLADDGYNILALSEACPGPRTGTVGAPLMPVDGAMRLDLDPSGCRGVIPPSPQGTPAPTVHLGTFYDPDADYVGIDIRPAMINAVQHLAETGRRNVILMYGGASIEVNRAYHDAFEAGLERAGISGKAVAHAETGGEERAQGRRSIARYLSDHDCPDGVIVESDAVAIGVYRGLLDRGIRVPDDVAIVGCDGIPDVEYLECPLSTMETPFEAICGLAWQYLRARMADPTIPPQQTLLPARLVVRESSAPSRHREEVRL